MAIDPIPITINGKTIDPTSPDAPPEFSSLDASQSNYILIQCVGRLNQWQKAELKELHVVIQEYVSENTYLCRYEPADLAVIQEKPFVVHCCVYSPRFVIHSSLKGAIDAAETGTEGGYKPTLNGSSADVEGDNGVSSKSIPMVDVILHEDADHSPAHIEQHIREQSYADPESLVVGDRHLRLSVGELQHLDKIAALDSVRSIEQVPRMGLFNDRACRIVKAINDPSVRTKAVTDEIAKFKGQEQIVILADSGFDTTDSSVKGEHPAFVKRVKDRFPIARSGITNDDFTTHGTHVAGSILGSHEAVLQVTAPAGRKTGPTTIEKFTIAGPAPEAELVVQALGKDRTSETVELTNPADLYDKGPYEKYTQARIHCDAWGSLWDDKTNIPAPYGANDAKASDEAVWRSQDILICRAAGNYGMKNKRQQIGGHSSAKNSITVGASDTSRPRTEEGAYGPNLAFAFSPGGNAIDKDSSRGPTLQKRIKPDLVAPGICILSTCSRDPNLPRVDPSLPKDDPKQPKADLIDVDITGLAVDGTNEKLWGFMSGTSMATGIVAGCAAVLRQVVQVGTTYGNPSASFLKALLIHGAQDMSGHPDLKFSTLPRPSPIAAAPNGVQGFGRIDLAKSISLLSPPKAPNKQGFIYIHGAAVEGYIYEWPDLTIEAVEDKTPFLIATLVWTDPPGALLQNALKFSVYTPDTNPVRTRRGNRGEDEAGTDFDDVNNVQQVKWWKIPVGKVVIRVEVNLTKDDTARRGFWPSGTPVQPFAVVWSVGYSFF
ncbi:hypothetical protein MMC30_005401 [Trapelia coarctata]|nr:hypothetical protein [Trapelia coarctata]